MALEINEYVGAGNIKHVSEKKTTAKATGTKKNAAVTKKGGKKK